MSLIRRAHSAACHGFDFLFDPTEEPTNKRGGGCRSRCGSPGFSGALWESPSQGLQGFLEGKPFNQRDCRVCGTGGRGEDGSAGTSRELKTAADPQGASVSFLRYSGGGAPAVPAGLGARQSGEAREGAEVGSLHLPPEGHLPLIDAEKKKKGGGQLIACSGLRVAQISPRSAAVRAGVSAALVPVSGKGAGESTLASVQVQALPKGLYSLRPGFQAQGPSLIGSFLTPPQPHFPPPPLGHSSPTELLPTLRALTFTPSSYVWKVEEGGPREKCACILAILQCQGWDSGPTYSKCSVWKSLPRPTMPVRG